MTTSVGVLPILVVVIMLLSPLLGWFLTPLAANPFLVGPCGVASIALSAWGLARLEHPIGVLRVMGLVLPVLFWCALFAYELMHYRRGFAPANSGWRFDLMLISPLFFGSVFAQYFALRPVL